MQRLHDGAQYKKRGRFSPARNDLTIHSESKFWPARNLRHVTPEVEDVDGSLDAARENDRIFIHKTSVFTS